MNRYCGVEVAGEPVRVKSGFVTGSVKGSVLGGHFQDGQNRAVFGFEALLPLNIGSQIWVDSEGEVRITLEKDLQLTSRLGAVGEVQYDTETGWEGRTLLLFNVNRVLDLTAGWHSKYGFGGGLNLRY